MKKRELTQEEKEVIKQAKKELTDYKFDIMYLEEKLEDLERTKELASKTTSNLSLTNTSHNNFNNDKIGNSLARIEYLQQVCDEKTKSLLLKKFDIDEKIESLKAPYRDILFYRYSRNMDWNEVIRKLRYSEQWVYHMHGEALYFYSKL